MQNDLVLWIERAGAGGVLSKADGLRVRGELWAMLARKAEVLSLGDSSIREEQAEELLRSLCYVVSLALEPMGAEEAGKILSEKPFRALYREGMRRLDRRIERAKTAYARALETALPTKNLAYRDTLQNIGTFFDAYRPDLFAHDIPCMIDYPLFREVSGLGASYIEAYLAQWSLENDFLSKFDFDRVRRLLEAHFMDAREQVVNLFEPVAANALALTLLYEDAAGLAVSTEDGARVKALSGALGDGAFRARLTRAADALALATGTDAALLRDVSAELSARVSLLPAGGMGGIFTSIE